MTKKGKVTTLVTIGERTLLFDIENKCSLITSVIRTLDTSFQLILAAQSHAVDVFTLLHAPKTDKSDKQKSRYNASASHRGR